jgi:hypothetical protein
MESGKRFSGLNMTIPSQDSMGNPKTEIADLCRELGVTRRRVLLKSGHFAGINRGCERFEGFPDFLNLALDQINFFRRQVRSG